MSELEFNELTNENETFNPEMESIDSEDMLKTVFDYSNENDVNQILDVHLKG